MSVNITYIVNKINEIIRFSNETRHAIHIAIPDDKLVQGIFNTGRSQAYGLRTPIIKQLELISADNIIRGRSAGKNKKKTTRKKSLKH